MKYLEFTFRLTPADETAGDVLVALLADAGFDSFVRPDDEADPIKAYIRRDAYRPEALSEALAAFPLPETTISYDSAEAEDKDWNEEWERNFFEPLVVDGRCVVHCTFHKNVPAAEYDITIDPRMSWEIMGLLNEINKRKTTVLVVTHEKSLVNALKKRVIYIEKGRVLSDRMEGQYSER